MQEEHRIRAFFDEHPIDYLNALSRRVVRVNQRQDIVPGSFVYPGLEYVDSLQVDGQHIGYIDYGINPVMDSLHITLISIQPAFQRQGFGLGTLWSLWLTHQVPLVPLNPYTPTEGFWLQSRKRFAAAGACIESDLRGIEHMNDARQRWANVMTSSDVKRAGHDFPEKSTDDCTLYQSAGPDIR